MYVNMNKHYFVVTSAWIILGRGLVAVLKTTDSAPVVGHFDISLNYVTTQVTYTTWT